MPRPSTARLTDHLLHAGPTPARQLTTALGITPATLSRRVAELRDRVVRIGRARATHYALLREVRTFGHTWPVHRMDAGGRPRAAASLHALHTHHWWYEHDEASGPPPPWLHGEPGLGIFPDLPWFLDDLRPQGFMGRAFARRHAESLGLSPDPRLWGANAVLAALLLHGEDLPGDFVLGERVLERVQRAALSPPAAVELEERAAVYTALAKAALAGDVPGSSAGGEQPKFTACLDDGGIYRHVIVKFSPPRDTAAGRRWADLLVCEHLAAETLAVHGIAACRTNLVEGPDRTYLEATRFDRVGAHGRRGVVTLLAVDNAYYGRLDSWHAAADRMERDGWLDSEDAETLRARWWFGTLIADTDLHFGNVSLELASVRPLHLAPAYDALPMHYRPTAAGEIVDRDYAPPLPAPGQLSTWQRAAEIALELWERVSCDGRISPEFRKEAARVLGAMRALVEKLAR